VHIARDGREAIEFLTRSGKFAGFNATRPRLVVTDIKMPIVDGLELAQWIRDEQAFANLPIVVVTSSDLSEDRERCAEIGVNGYFLKPAAYKGWETLIQDLQKRWLPSAPATAQAAQERPKAD
jgi:CheY-like chemotaxis protein